MSIFNFWKLWKTLIIVKYGYISHPTPWSQEHLVIMGLAAYEVPAKLCSGCAGCIPWESPAANPAALPSCNTGWEQSQCHGQGEFTQHSLGQHSHTWCCFKSRAALMLLMSGGAGGRHWTCSCRFLLTAEHPLPSPHRETSLEAPGELALPLQRAVPMDKAEICLNPTYFLLKSCVHTYICIIGVYI